MPIFKFIINGHLHFHGHLDSEQCEGTNRNGHQCTRRTVIGLGLCWQHLLSTEHLRIKQSRIAGAGKGLFALDRTQPANAIIFNNNDLICQYDGELIDLHQLEDRYDDKTAPYGYQLNANRFEDGALHRGVGTLANRPPAGTPSNARFAITHGRGLNSRCQLRATRIIRNDSEIYAPYGVGYRMNEAGVVYRTK